MSGNRDLLSAIQLLRGGERRKAAHLLLAIEAQITEPGSRLEFIDAALSALDPLEHCDKACQLAGEGSEIARARGEEDLRAYFMARRTHFLMTKVATAHHGRTSLKLAPGWIGFATESDLHRYESLSQEYHRLNSEVDDLIRGASEIAEKLGNARVRAYVLMQKGSIESSRYLEEKSECRLGILRAKAWRRLPGLRSERVLMFGWGHGRRLGALVKSFSNDFLLSARLFEMSKDPLAASAYYNLANQLRTANRFRAARKYLKMARSIAELHGDRWIIGQCDRLGAIIKKRNKDIPNYLEGERRDRAE